MTPQVPQNLDGLAAAVEAALKSRTLTVTGKLSRANWDTHAYAGYTGQPGKLQFRPKASTTYSTFKSLTTSSTGTLTTTVKASADGYWRYTFAGTTTTPAATATGDFVDVKQFAATARDPEPAQGAGW